MKSFLKIWDPFLPDEPFERGGVQNHLACFCRRETARTNAIKIIFIAISQCFYPCFYPILLTTVYEQPGFILPS